MVASEGCGFDPTAATGSRFCVEFKNNTACLRNDSMRWTVWEHGGILMWTVVITHDLIVENNVCVRSFGAAKN